MSHSITKIDAIFDEMKFGSIFLSILLSTLILFSTLRMTVTYAYYELDPIGFIEKLCENKDKPELECNGKCQLKKVAESSTENQQTPTKYTSLKEITLFVVNKLKVNFTELISSDTQNFDYSNLYAFYSINQIDKPPQV